MPVVFLKNCLLVRDVTQIDIQNPLIEPSFNKRISNLLLARIILGQPTTRVFNVFVPANSKESKEKEVSGQTKHYI